MGRDRRIRVTSIRLIKGIALVAMFLFGGATGAYGQTPDLILTVGSEIGRPGNEIPTRVFIQNITDSIFAFQMAVCVDRADLAGFPATLSIQTCLECADSACTSVVSFPCTTFLAPVTVLGTLVESWDYVEARVFADTQIRVTAISDLGFGNQERSIPPNTGGVLVEMVSVLACDVPDTLTNRTASYEIDSSLTYFSAPSSELIDSITYESGAVTVGFNLRGDMNGDGFRDAVDLNSLIDVLFFNGTAGCPPYVSDFNCDGFADATDLNGLIDFLFFDPAPPPC